VEPKKRSMGAVERDEFLRAAWRELVARKTAARRLVFVDEMGSDVSLTPLYAWSRKGERAFGSTPRNGGKNVTLLASITVGGVGPCLAVEGATTREVFEAYTEWPASSPRKRGGATRHQNDAPDRGSLVEKARIVGQGP